VHNRARSGILCICEAPDSIGCSTQPIGRWLGRSEIEKNWFKSQMRILVKKLGTYNN
jgi:hypothetical protein